MSDQPFEIEKKKQSEIRTEEKKEQKESPYKAVSLPPQEKSVSGERKAPKKADEKKLRQGAAHPARSPAAYRHPTGG